MLQKPRYDNNGAFDFLDMAQIKLYIANNCFQSLRFFDTR